MRAVISLGGSILTRAVENKTLAAYRDAFNELAEEADTLVVVTGAGDLKRYIDALNEFDVSESRKDLLGISATRMHANMLAALLDANVAVPRRIEEVAQLAKTHDIVVLGGLMPGQSTDAVAAECAELIDADRLILATTVDGVYDRDPATHGDAMKYDTLRYQELLDLVMGQESGAGAYELIDVTAAKLIERSRIETVIMDGRDPAILSTAFTEEHGGTVITS